MKITAESYFIFSGGEVHCKLSDTEQDIGTIICLDYTMNGFMAVCELKEIFDRKGYAVRLIYPYLPYARQDRVMVENEPFSLKIFCELLNSRNFHEILILDPHSDVGPALINNCKIVPQWEIAKQVIPQKYFDDEEVIFVSPDAGAYKKLSKLITNDKRIAIGTKNRDSSGKITHTSVYAPVSMLGRTCVMVDDICDGGRTFIELAKSLKDEGADEVILYVTHGIFSQGLFCLRDAGIDEVYTTNSILHENSKWFEAEGIKELLTIVDVV